MRHVVPDDGAGAGRGVAPQVVRDDEPGDATAADVHLDLVVLEHAAVEVGERDGAQLVGVCLERAQTLALLTPVGDGGAAGHPAEEGVAAEAAAALLGVDRRALAGDAAAGHGHGPREPRQVVQQRVVSLQDARVGLLLPLQRMAADEVAFARREADRERGQRAAEDGDLDPLRVDAELVAVERQAGLESQGVAGAEADGHGARVDQCVPEGRPVVRADEELERDGLSRVAGAGDARLHEASVARQPQRGHAQLVAQRLRQPAVLDEPAEDVSGRLALQGHHGDLAGLVAHLHVGEVGEVLAEVVPVLVPVGGVDDEQVLAVDEAVEVGVVDGAAGLGGHHRVLRLEQVEGLGVVGEHVLQEGRRARPAQHEAAHVRDVEEAGARAGGEVLGDDAGGVLDRHVPAAEVHHPGAGGDVLRVEGRAQERRGRARVAAHCAHSLSRPSPSRMSSALMPE